MKKATVGFAALGPVIALPPFPTHRSEDARALRADAVQRTQMATQFRIRGEAVGRT